MSDLFEYQQPTESQTLAMQKTRAKFKETRDLIVKLIPDCRERSLAITKLEEVSMWANKAIVFVGAVNAETAD